MSELESLGSSYEKREVDIEMKYVQSPAECMLYYHVAVRKQGFLDANHLYYQE